MGLWIIQDYASKIILRSLGTDSNYAGALETVIEMVVRPSGTISQLQLLLIVECLLSPFNLNRKQPSPISRCTRAKSWNDEFSVTFLVMNQSLIYQKNIKTTSLHLSAEVVSSDIAFLLQANRAYGLILQNVEHAGPDPTKHLSICLTLIIIGVVWLTSWDGNKTICKLPPPEV